MVTSTIQAPVNFTQSAINELKALMAKPDHNPNYKLRVGVKGGGCSGMTYVLAFDEPTENDEVFEIEGIECVMNKAHGIYLTGMNIDWENGLNNRGFSFTNPNASSTCGCGTSFAV
jgi:iron-sulfur cluster assembly accessory protein